MACVHDIVRHGFCSQCRSAVDTGRNVFIRFSYLGNGLQLRPEFVGTIKRNVWMKSLKQKRLTLVLGLRGTLYDARRVSLLSDGEKYLTREVNSRSDLRRSNQVFPDYGEALFKLRPFVHEFLREANKLFQMHVYDLVCNPEHAQEVISLLDPHGTYFNKRIITDRDSEIKNLDLVLADERGIVILDDKNLCWWPDDLTNLLQIAPYHFFKHDNNSNWIMKLVDVFKKTLCNESDPKSYVEQRGDEDAGDGGLANALELLKEMHRKFFDEDEDSRDVRALFFP
ncbi:RNA polymerase II C-terminal domain phosphatase-like 5 [Cardamine amara subsp. amara]|uniref:protein-serine/threonine phosphatase n=1 Tax=Cardamine amara subsp. amara TaxID=228776 RepID=A0ABD0ZZ35_CARAN